MSTTIVLDRVEVSPDVVLPYAETGSPEGAPILLLHGLTDSWRSFEPVLPYLAPEIRAIALTMRGHGDASRPQSGYDWPTLVSDLSAVLDALNIGNAILVGHSYGSLVAMHAAVLAPARVSGLVLMGAFTPRPELPLMRRLWDDIVSTLDDPVPPAVATEFQESTLARPVVPGIIDTAIAERLKLPARVWKAVFEPLLTMDLLDSLRRYKGPVRLIWGDRDAMATATDQANLLEAFPYALLCAHPGAGHALHWEDPESVADQISEFVLANSRLPGR
ncbi:MAG: alpha/beta fold hydrolase [Thermomicrobiales bacterium]